MMGPSAIGAQPPPEELDEWENPTVHDDPDEPCEWDDSDPFCTCSAGHSIEETDWNQCDSCGKPIYDEEPAVPPAPTFEENDDDCNHTGVGAVGCWSSGRDSCCRWRRCLHSGWLCCTAGVVMKPDTPTKTELRGEIARLNLELQKRDKCSFMGPMRDCPTHGESEELKHLRAEVSAWRERLGDDYEYNPDVPYVVMKTPNA